MDEILERAARLLGDDSLTMEKGLRTEGRNRVARVRRQGGASVIVKAMVTEDGSAFDRADDSSESPALAEAASKLHGALAARWPDLAPMPLYQPFRGRKPGADGE